jgi:hypothetical protein
MFNSWKKEILELSSKDAIDLYEEVKIDKDFINLRNYLNKHKDVDNSKDFIKLCEKNGLIKTYNAYRWDSKGFGNTSWTYVTSNKIYSHKVEPFDIKHDIYINTNCDDTYNMANIFRKKCEEANIPYLFKISESPFRDDSIIIYASDEVLDKYMDILEKIKEENKELVSRINTPPLLTTKVDYYGYGSEPEKSDDGRNRSYNVVRSNMIESSITDSARKWFYNNRNLTLNGVSIMDAIVKECYSRLTNSMQRNYNNAVEYEKEITRKNGTEFNEEVIADRLGYNIELLSDPDFQDKVMTNIRMNLPLVLKDEKLFNRYPMKSAINIPLESGKIYSVTYGDVARIIKRNVIGISKFDPNFVNGILKNINLKCSGENIESENFAFSTNFDINKIKNANIDNTKVDNKKLEFPKFEVLKDLATDYKVEFDKESNKLKVINIATGNSEDDVVTAQDALFANIWLTSTGLKRVEGEKRPGLTDAFDVDGALLYKYFIKGCNHSIEKTGNLNSLFLFKNAGKIKMTGADNMIARLFNNDYQTIFLDNYVHSRVEESKLPRTKCAEALIDLETANKRLEEAMNKKKK